MTSDSNDIAGPVDFVIIRFPAETATFTGEILDEISKLVEAGTIRVIDAIVMVKDDDGRIDAFELSEFDEANALESLVGEFAEFLAADDVANLAEAMDPGTVAGVLVYENVWAAPFAMAARRAGGELVADGRIHTQSIAAAIEAERELEEQGA
jgi:hypothetical protein